LVESLTNELEAQAQQLIDKIDAMGGAVSAIESGFQQREVADAAFRWQRALEQNEAIVVGVNKFVVEKEPHMAVMHVSEQLRQRQSERTAQVRAGRDSVAWSAALERLTRAATDGSNLMPPILESVQANATVGEICSRLSNVFGRFEPVDL
jgi:methylmalonyl-CoA mutase N-terminal domain/subunit